MAPGYCKTIQGALRHAGVRAHDADAKEGGLHIEEIAFCIAVSLALFRKSKSGAQ
jgi:hypothetical protein